MVRRAFKVSFLPFLILTSVPGYITRGSLMVNDFVMVIVPPVDLHFLSAEAKAFSLLTFIDAGLPDTVELSFTAPIPELMLV